MAKVLIVDDDKDTRELVRDILLQERHGVDCCSSADEAWDFIKTYNYDVLIFDWEMPGMTGPELLQKYRQSGGATPVIMLTARTSSPDKVKGFDSGADRYLTKPIDHLELNGFIRAVLRRAPIDEPTSISCGDLELSAQSSTVSCNGNSVQLSKRESDVLALLLSNHQRIIAHEELRAIAWTDSVDISSSTVRVFLTSLREKLSSIGSRIQILNVRGYGYQIKI